MSEDLKQRAQRVFAQLCEALDKREWEYTAKEADLVLHLSVNTQDTLVEMLLAVEADKSIIHVISPVCRKTDAEKKGELALAAAYANYGTVDGKYEYDMLKNALFYTVASCYEGCTLGDGFFYHLIDWTCSAAVHYNDRFLALNKGYITVEEFIGKK